MYKDKTHSVNAGVSAHLAHPLIVGTDWPGFHSLFGQCVGVQSRPMGTCALCSVFSSDARSSDTAGREGESAAPSQEDPELHGRFST